VKLCRFDDNRLGLVEGDTVRDVSAALEVLPPLRWPLPPGDPLVTHLDAVRVRVAELAPAAPCHPLDTVRLLSPVANPARVIGAPLNYHDHVTEAADPAIHHGVHLAGHEGFARPVDKFGLFLKSPTGLVGPADGVELVFPERRTDHELELVAVIGRGGRHIPRAAALEHVAGYAIGLDMTVRGPEDRSFRKSPDSYTVLGPWLVTADELPAPGDLAMSLHVDGVLRQSTRTSRLIADLPALIEMASTIYRLHPGDLLYTGTPAGVGAVHPGTILVAWIEGIGEMRVAVRGPA
jgi:2-keto-4-pentenoate hydratase/2-oxohepta-3-ene-1,7-dioic acid hydratase in catechol pathway